MLDQFNDLLSHYGWITYDILDLYIIREAVEKASTGDTAGAEAALVAYYSPDKIDQLLPMMIGVKPFRPRMDLARKAARDYREGRYYASTMVILALMDGLVSEMSENRRGTSAVDVNLEAWNSIAGHSKGLNELMRIFHVGRRTLRTEEISIPYRHGIMHGMDLGFDNQIVAAKTWAALFALREWAIKVLKGELHEPPEKPQPTIAENLRTIGEISIDRFKIDQWTPRGITPGVNVPISGEPTDYEEGSPERILVEFLSAWKKRNYG